MARSARSWSASTSRAFGVGMLLATYVAAQAGSFVHLATVEHSICADHGEVVHGAHDEHHPVAQQTASIEAVPSAEHEHCGLDQLDPSAAPTLEVPAAAGLPSMGLVPVESTLDEAEGWRAHELWRAAPKHSPPAV